jgi:MOSC domain-containing protein YiiM
MSEARLRSVHVGRIAPLGPDAVPSGFIKTAVVGAVDIGLLGLADDEQADLSVHGGPEKAVYAYPASRYSAWAAAFPTIADRFAPGCMGENLCIDGLDEDATCVGDVHATGSALLQVCQPRQPCFKLALALGEPRLGKHMVRTGHCGWYYRVVRGGTVQSGDAVTLHDRPNPQARFADLVRFVNFGPESRQELDMLAQLPGIASTIAARARALGSSAALR